MHLGGVGRDVRAELGMAAESEALILDFKSLMMADRYDSRMLWLTSIQKRLERMVSEVRQIEADY